MYPRRQRTVTGFILATAFAVSLVLFAGVYLVTTRVYGAVVKENAVTVSETLAQSTFNSMFQIMRQGWTRAQLEEFVGMLQKESARTGHAISIYRGDKVTALFGSIEQDPIEGPVAEAFRQGRPRHEITEGGIRYTYPLTARAECLRCHVNASAEDVLGVIEVRQNLEPLVEQAKNRLLVPLLLIAPLPFLVALGVALVLNHKVRRTLGVLEHNIDGVTKVSDLTNIEFRDMDLGFADLNGILHKLRELVDKLRMVAVDKDLLEFEIRLLEKFVITSEVVKDWHEYINHLLIDINKVVHAYNLFSIFKIDDEVFDLEIFWVRPPTERTQTMMEGAICAALTRHAAFREHPTLHMKHTVADPAGAPIELDREEIELQTKTLIVDSPKIGGIVGIGVQADIIKDDMRRLAMESILSTLLNVVGSVKAIYKYTRDLEYYATRDPLTDLYNQRMFWELLGYEIDRGERHNYKMSLLVIDLDNFKSINDSHGHAFGDKFLRRLAEELHGALRKGDMLARYGGDEFVVILPEADVEQAGSVCQHILERAGQLVMDAPDGAKVKATLSIGVAVSPDHASNTKDLFMFADNMMYKAKTEGKNRFRLPGEEDVVGFFRNTGEISQIIYNAIDNDSVVPYFQPIVDNVTGEVHAVEVLGRIQMPDGRLLSAHEFIEIAEKMSVAHQLDYIIITKAFEKVRAENYTGRIFINLSPRMLLLSEFIPRLRALAKEYELPPGRIVFEITERDTVKNFTLLKKFVTDLKSEGYGLAVDDFGSGFASFRYLKHFPIDYVKIEGDFVVSMVEDPRDEAFVRSMALLAEKLGAKVIAEYVEGPKILDLARRIGIAYGQGFFIGRPSPQLLPLPGMAVAN